VSDYPAVYGRGLGKNKTQGFSPNFNFVFWAEARILFGRFYPVINDGVICFTGMGEIKNLTGF
jgi:hypothetical protein